MAGPAIIVHGGAGRLRSEYEPEARAGCLSAARRGWEHLQGGGSAVDAAEAAVCALEDDPCFNAGTGSVLNAAGQVRLDASIMDGSTLAAGGVAHVQGVRNPVRLARRVMEQTRHVLMVAAGAEALAEAGERISPEQLITPAARERWVEHYGTVGCVALDRDGRLAAATSTGGRFGSLPGRVGDSPLIGAGTYASPAGAVSCTGIGEDIIRVVLAKHAVDRMAQGASAEQCGECAIAHFAELTASEAGLILIDAHGRIGHAHNAAGMALAFIDDRGEHAQV